MINNFGIPLRVTSIFKLDLTLLPALYLCVHSRASWCCYHESQPVPAGKTYIGCALDNTTCRKFISVNHVRLPELFVNLSIAAQGDANYLKVMAPYKKVLGSIFRGQGLSILRHVALVEQDNLNDNSGEQNISFSANVRKQVQVTLGEHKHPTMMRKSKSTGNAMQDSSAYSRT